MHPSLTIIHITIHRLTTFLGMVTLATGATFRICQGLKIKKRLYRIGEKIQILIRKARAKRLLNTPAMPSRNYNHQPPT
jgi:hypothetical protein